VGAGSGPQGRGTGLLANTSRTARPIGPQAELVRIRLHQPALCAACGCRHARNAAPPGEYRAAGSASARAPRGMASSFCAGGGRSAPHHPRGKPSRAVVMGRQEAARSFVEAGSLSEHAADGHVELAGQVRGPSRRTGDPGWPAQGGRVSTILLRGRSRPEGLPVDVLRGLSVAQDWRLVRPSRSMGVQHGGMFCKPGAAPQAGQGSGRGGDVSAFAAAHPQRFDPLPPSSFQSCFGVIHPVWKAASQHLSGGRGL